MSQVANISVGLQADSSGYKAGIDRARAENKKFRDDLAQTKGALESLKKGLGEESALGNALKLMQGAGAIAGLSLAGMELNKMADKLAEIRQMQRDGADAGTIAEELAKSVPVYGQIWEAGRKVRAEIDGSADAARKLASETAMVNAAADYATLRFIRMNDETTGLRGQLRKARDELDLIGKRAGDQNLIRIDFSTRDALKDAKKNFDADMKRIADEGAAGRSTTDADYNAKLKAYRDAKESADEIGTGSFNARFFATRYDEEASRRAALDRAKKDFDAIAGYRSSFTAKENAERLAKMKELQDGQANINRLAGQQRLEELKAQGLAAAAIEQSQYRQRIDAMRAYHKQTTDMYAEMREAMLRFQGKDVQAEGLQGFREAAAKQQELRDGIAKQFETTAGAVAEAYRAAGIGAAIKQAIAESKSLPGAVGSAVNVSHAINAARDQHLDLAWKQAMGDKLRAWVGNLPEKPSDLLGGPGMLGDVLKNKLFGVGNKFDWGDGPQPPPPLSTAIERRFDFATGLGNAAEDPQKKQLAKLGEAVKRVEDSNTILRKILDRTATTVGVG